MIYLIYLIYLFDARKVAFLTELTLLWISGPISPRWNRLITTIIFNQDTARSRVTPEINFRC